MDKTKKRQSRPGLSPVDTFRLYLRILQYPTAFVNGHKNKSFHRKEGYLFAKCRERRKTAPGMGKNQISGSPADFLGGMPFSISREINRKTGTRNRKKMDSTRYTAAFWGSQEA